MPRLDTPPGLPQPLAGFLNLGGTAVPVLDPAVLLGIGPARRHAYSHLLLLAGTPRALLVDRVLDVAPEGAAALRPIERERSLGGLVTAAAEAGGLTAHLLDPSRLLLTGEETILANLSEAAQRRLDSWTAA